MLVAHEKGSNSVGVGILESEAGEDHSQGKDLLGDYMMNEEDSSAENSSDENTEQVPDVPMDRSGNPRLPDHSSLKLKNQQLLVREIFRKAYVKFMKKSNVSHPQSFRFNDLSKLVKKHVNSLWHHWEGIAKSGKPIIEFINAQPKDLPFTSGEGPSRRRWKRNYLEVDDQLDDDKHDDSPAAHKNTNRMLYLQSLSINSRYQKLLELLFQLPKTGSSSPQRSALPKWASWTWDRKFLPRDLHTSGDSFRTALATLKNFQWSTAGGGTPIVLGFGLLMQECAHAQEAEDDDTSSPSFLLSSRLGVQRLDDVVNAVVEVTLQVKAELEGSSDKEERRREEEERKQEEEERKGKGKEEEGGGGRGEERLREEEKVGVQ
ncbi:hypothetical protein HYDPIDRAFT_34166 [Hydnomerulius pinastri MD-312]|uniref:Uncharacterized protein n=1 Tax=Hydnomerulius pinastri MD-312 TaxID=994086 RepID=A0A0C9VYJ1_9AGAM|nr:hypothetical protein HYDPIDRAFT_34166 [Hydnomerulius pinastri MD-312]